MRLPDLLFAHEQNIKTIGNRVFTDLKVNELLARYFSESAQNELIRVLSCPCTGENIECRQSLFFSLLDNHGIAEHLKRVQTALFALSRNARAFFSAEGNAEKAAAFITLLRGYVEFIDISAKTPREGFLLSRFADFYNEMSVCEQTQRAKLAIERANDKFARLAPICMTPGGRMRADFFTGETVNKRLLHDIHELGIDYAGRTGDRHKPSNNMREALFALCREYSDELCKIREEFEPFCCPQAYNDYIEQLRVILNITELLERLKEKKIPLCRAEISREREIYISGGFDSTLDAKPDAEIIPNDVKIDGDIRFVFLLGANGGGKTTYLRMLGTVLLFFINGLPVPCEKARIYPFTQIFTHFPEEENFVGEGRLQNEIKRLANILENSNENTITLLNETFSGTNEKKAENLAVDTAKDIIKKNSFGVFVTHQRGVYKRAEPLKNISFLETAPAGLGRYKIRKLTGMPSSGMYTILDKYGLTKKQLEEKECTAR